MLVHLAGGGGAVIAGAKNGVVYSPNPDSGALNWSRRLGQGGSLGGIHWGMASDGTRVYAAISDVTVNRASGLDAGRSEEHTSELQSLMRSSYAVFCLKKKKTEESNIHIRT